MAGEMNYFLEEPLPTVNLDSSGLHFSLNVKHELCSEEELCDSGVGVKCEPPCSQKDHVTAERGVERNMEDGVQVKAEREDEADLIQLLSESAALGRSTTRTLRHGLTLRGSQPAIPGVGVDKRAETFDREQAMDRPSNQTSIPVVNIEGGGEGAGGGGDEHGSRVGGEQDWWMEQEEARGTAPWSGNFLETPMAGERMASESEDDGTEERQEGEDEEDDDCGMTVLEWIEIDIAEEQLEEENGGSLGLGQQRTSSLSASVGSRSGGDSHSNQSTSFLSAPAVSGCRGTSEGQYQQSKPSTSAPPTSSSRSTSDGQDQQSKCSTSTPVSSSSSRDNRSNHRPSPKASMSREPEDGRDTIRNDPDKKRNYCPHCPYSARKRSKVVRHLQIRHQGLKEYSCPHCDYKCGWTHNDLRRHIDTVHQGLRNFPCPHCEQRFGMKNNLKKHVETVHQGLKRFQCPHCEYRAAAKATLQTHMEVIHQRLKKFLCPQCGGRFSQISNVKKHLQAVHQRLKKYACPYCNYKGSEACLLKRHIATVHEGEKRHECPHCEYRSGEKGNLMRHIRCKHEGLRKFSCTQCRGKFGTASHLKRHMENVHASA